MRLFLLTVLLGLLGITWWALRTTPEKEGGGARTGPPDPVDYFVEALDLSTFDAAGNRLRRLRADRAKHHRTSGETRLTAPRLSVYEKELELWRIRSDSGTLSGDRSILRLHGRVEALRAATPEQPAMKLVTREALVKPDEEYAETSEAVTITSGENWIRAVGMKAWLRSPERIRFLSNTRAYYVATP